MRRYGRGSGGSARTESESLTSLPVTASHQRRSTSIPPPLPRIPMHHRRLALMLVPVLVLACSDEIPRSSSGGAPAGGAGALQEIARIGSVDGPGALTEVGGVRIGPDGRVYVAQPQEELIRVFDAGGEPVASIGRSGGGPGEFRDLAHMGIRGDTLYVSDDNLGRVSYFDLDGRFFTSEQWVSPQFSRPPTVYMPTAPAALLGDGTALVQPGMMVAATGSIDLGVFTGEYSTPFLRIDRQSQVVDTVTWEQQRNTLLVMAHEGGQFIVPTPFDENPLYSVAPDGRGIVTVHRTPSPDTREASFQVTLVAPTRDTLFHVALPFAPVPVSEERLRAAVEERLEQRGRGRAIPRTETVMAALQEEGLVPATLPPVTALMTAQDGTIWLRREELGDRAVDWIVLQPDGSVGPSLSLPARQRVVAAYGQSVVAVEGDDLDVPYLVLYRLDP